MPYKIPDDCPAHLLPYAKMLKVGLPSVAVKQKMMVDKVPEEDFDTYLDPNRAPVAAPPPPEPEENSAVAAAPQETTEAPSNVVSNLPAIEPSRVDMSGMSPMPVKKTLIIVNSFLSRTVNFLNRFVNTCEDRLTQVDTRIQRMELRMRLLENKYESIDWLRNAPDEPPPPAPNSAAPPAAADQPPAQDVQEGEAPAPAAAVDPLEALKNDERYRLYFKMLSYRVPSSAVKLKMNADGVPQDVMEQILNSA